MKIKAIVFDLFGVLVVPGSTPLLRRTFPALADKINDLEHQMDLDIISRPQFLQALSELLDMPTSDIEKRFYDINVRDEPVFEWLKELGSSDKYKIGLLSNIGSGWINDFIPKAEQDDLFDAIVLSCDIGIMKPGVAIFEYAAQKLGVEAGECIMIDDLAVNIEGAINAGMQGVVFNSLNQVKQDVDRILRENNA